MQIGHITRRGLLGGALATGAGLAPSGARAARSVSPRTREYWIAAVPTTWNIVPNGRNAIEGERFEPSRTLMDAVVYREFTPGFKRMLPRRGQLGLIGPLIRARVGDEILVHFLNLDTKHENPHSMHFHGVHYAVGSDGAFVPGFSGRGADVKVRKRFTYRLRAEADSAGIWPYHDHSPSMHESIRGGLYGAMSILGADEPSADHENVVFFSSHLEFMTINGRAFIGNTPVYHARIGDMVQWDVLTIGDDFHTFHIHGHRWREPDGTPIDTKTIGPAESFGIRFREDAPGAWLYHCHVEGHMAAGMIGLYRVRR